MDRLLCMKDWMQYATTLRDMVPRRSVGLWRQVLCNFQPVGGIRGTYYYDIQ